MSVYPRDIGRDEWNALCADLGTDSGGAFTSEARLAHDHASLEFRNDGVIASDVDTYVTEAATDIRVGDVQLIVGGDGNGRRGALLVARGGFPISRWSVLWEGDLFL
jgi:hypothetical protein